MAYADLLDRHVFTPVAVHANGWDDGDCGSTHFSSEAVCETSINAASPCSAPQATRAA